MLKGGRNIDWRVLRNISFGWVTTPVIAALICFISLFFLKNVFDQPVFKTVYFELSPKVVERLVGKGVPVEDLADIEGVRFTSSVAFLNALHEHTYLTRYQENMVLETCKVHLVKIRSSAFGSVNVQGFSKEQLAAVWVARGEGVPLRVGGRRGARQTERGMAVPPEHDG